MTENRYRPSSPPGRRYGDYGDPRASTGMVFSSSFDPRMASHPRPTGNSFASTRPGSVYSTQGVARKTFLDESHPGGGSIIRTEYPVRPRTNSSIASESRRPFSTYVTRPSSPPRVRPTVVNTSSRDVPRSPVLATREDRYLMPAASQGRSHERHSSATRGDQDRLGSARVTRQPEYHRVGGYNAYAYPARDGPLHDEGFSYTTPKEQFLQESSRLPQRRESYSRRERPISTLGLPEYRQSARRDLGPPPSSSRPFDRIDRADSVRQSGTRINDLEDRSGEIPRRRISTRAPVLHQYRDDGYSSARDDRDSRPAPIPRHDRLEGDDRAPKYTYRDDREREGVREPARDIDRRDRERDRERDRDRNRERDRERDRDRDRDRDRHREPDNKLPDERRLPRSRDIRLDHAGIRKGLTTAAAVAAGAGLAGAVVKHSKGPNDGSESDNQKHRKHRRRRHHHASDEHSPEESGTRVDKDLKSTGDDRLPHDRRRDEGRTDDAVDDREDRHERRRHHRHKNRDRPEHENESDTTEDAGGRDPRQRPYEKERDADIREPPRQRRDREHSRDVDRDGAPLEQRTISPGEDEDNRPRRVQLVEPGEKKEDLRPRGILKPPRAVPFPEDPHPEREGVAPLKDATKDGVPSNARWTKISRALVNPEALEKAHERFEERDDYVIVLRVISREEIMKLAEKTKELREARERQWQAELEERRRRRREKGGHGASSEQSSDDEQRPRLTIDQAPVNQGIHGDPRVYLAQQQQQSRNEQVAVPAQPGTAAPPAAESTGMGVHPQQPPQGMPVPEILIEPVPGSYSTNV